MLDLLQKTFYILIKDFKLNLTCDPQSMTRIALIRKKMTDKGENSLIIQASKTY